MADSIDTNPQLRDLWDSSKNEDASKVLVRSYRAAWWRCPKGHAFQRTPRAMLSDPSCPECSAGPMLKSVADARPSIVPMWHPEKNGDLVPAKVDATHTGNAWWRCHKGHEFQRAPLLMVRDIACPVCAVIEKSLATTAPAVAAEWHPVRNGDLTADQVDADHVMNVWWQCPKGHEYQATVRSRARGARRCPTCYGGWSIESLRAFVKSLLTHVRALNPSELFALAMQAGAFADKDSRPFVMAVSTGKFPVEELEKFAEGKPSMVDDFASNKDFSLEIVDGKIKIPEDRPSEPVDPFSLPDAPVPTDGPETVDVDVSRDVDATGQAAAAATAEADDAMPLVKTRDALAALDSVLVANADAETVKFLLDSAKAKLWRHAYVDPAEAREQAQAFEGDVYSRLVRERFLNELDDADKLPIPEGYSFRPQVGAPITPPNLMQRRVAVSVRNEKRFGNWSGMGAGKTLSAIVATRVVGASLTVICCPNAVVDNWANEIEQAFPASSIAKKTWHPVWNDPHGKTPRYLILNYEQFQQPNSEAELVAFIEANVADFVVVDEIHYAKQRDAGAEMSKRKRLVQGLILEAGKKNADLCVLGMSGTPVINTLQEGKSLVEMITGHRHDDLETRATVQNCMRLYQRLVTLGTRWKPAYKIQLDVLKEEIDCEHVLDEVREIGRRKGTTLELEQVLTRVRLPKILEHIAPGEKVLVYTHYVDGIASVLREAIDTAGFHAGMLTGETDEHDLTEFLKPDGKVDVLVASSRVGTGVNGLQYVCQKLILNALPWTNAEYEQLVGRLFRQGSRFDRVKVVIPVTYAEVNGERWSYCESKLNRLEYKKSIADAAVDGVVPEGNLRTPAQAQQDILDWLARLDLGKIHEVTRRVIKIPLSGEPSEVARRVAKYGDFAKMNNRWYAANSDTTHMRLSASPEEWAHYHTEYRKLRESWPVVPFKEELRWLSERSGLVVGDFGCGEALVAKGAGEAHRIHSFDHVAVDDTVVACDVSKVPLEDGTLDLAIFCLSLMGTNFTDYIREAHRCLRLDGYLHLWEPTSYFDDVGKFTSALAKLGFDVMAPESAGAFTRIYAVRNAKKPDPELVLPFRGAGR